MRFDKSKFRQLRARSGLSVQEIADACHVSTTMVSRWGTPGDSSPRPSKISPLAILFQCHVDDLGTYKPGEEPKLELPISFLTIFRERAKLSTEDLAKKIGVEEEVLKDWEILAKPIDHSFDQQLQETLNLSPREMHLIGDQYPNYIEWREKFGTWEREEPDTTNSSVEAFRNDAIQAIISLDIPPDAMVKVLRCLKEIKKGPDTKDIEE